VICGDGRDLTSGYGFVFGGWNDSATCIVRGGTVLAQTREVTIPQTKGTHRRWFYIRAEKHGADLSFFVDDKLALAYTDPEPLAAGQVALWTHNNGLMVSRVRISHVGKAPMETPALVPRPPPKCIYDIVPRLDGAGP